MTFRNDHEAAVARASALDQELERTKAELDAQRIAAEATLAEAQVLREENTRLRAASRPGVVDSKPELAPKPAKPKPLAPVPAPKAVVLAPLVAWDDRPPPRRPRRASTTIMVAVMGLVIAGALGHAVQIMLYGPR